MNTEHQQQEQAKDKESSSCKKSRPTPAAVEILAVGEGDFSLSLALARAYGGQVSLTACTIVPSQQNLSFLYPHVDAILEELSHRGVTVLFGIDATQLHKHFPAVGSNKPPPVDAKTTTTTTTKQRFDLILFYHPHLGISEDEDKEVEQAQRHECLIAHYLASAAACLKPCARVHLCLCGTQPETWKVSASAQRLGLQQVKPGKPTTASPWHDVMHLSNALIANEDSASFAAPRKYRNGKQGSRHWLGKYGYCHRRTQGVLYEGLSSDTNVEGSIDLLFQANIAVVGDGTTKPKQPTPIVDEASSTFVCPICLTHLPSSKVYNAHLEAPALPCDVELVQFAKEQRTHEAATTPSTQKETNCIRLRKYLQHQFGKSRSAASQLIHAGKISLNGHVVLDSARLVFPGTKVEIKDEEEQSLGETPSSAIKIEIVARIDDNIQIVWKPVGLRTKGHFAGTLEDLVTRQENAERMESLTRLDTGLSGLCLLYKVAPKSPPTTVRHRFTALVLGNLSSFSTIELVLEPEKHRRWGNGAADSSQKSGEKEPSQPCKVDVCVLETCLFDVQSGTDDAKLTLSTIQLDVVDMHSCIGSLLSFALRKQCNLRVVGDRFSNKEYVKLPRSIRNRIKQKICLGCTSITVNGQEFDHPVPDKWNAKFWRQFLRKAL